MMVKKPLIKRLFCKNGLQAVRKRLHTRGFSR
jgi:hypothetical protein